MYKDTLHSEMSNQRFIIQRFLFPKFMTGAVARNEPSIHISRYLTIFVVVRYLTIFAPFSSVDGTLWEKPSSFLTD